MRRRKRPVVACVHGLQHVERFAAANLADHDAVGSHAQGVPHEISNGDLALPFDVRRPSLEADDVRLGEAKLRGVLDRDYSFAVGDEGRQHTKQGRLARARPARHDDVRTPAHTRSEEPEHARSDRAKRDELIRPERDHRELADGQNRTAERKGRDDRVHPRTVWKSRVHPR
jgi:hypothetical protein